MSDTELLLPDDTISANNSKRIGNVRSQFEKVTFWLREFIGERSKKDSDTNELPLSFWQLFSFGDRLDYFMLAIGLFCSILNALMYIFYIILFGRIIYLMISQPSFVLCQNKLKNLSITTDRLVCPLGIHINAFNYDQMHKFCQANNNISASASFTISAGARIAIMTDINSLLIVGTVVLLSMSLRNFLLELAAKRQTARIRKLLFQAILRRNIGYFDTHSIGQLGTTLFDNIDKLELGIGFHFSIVIVVVTSSISSLITALILNWKFTLILISIAPFVHIITCLFSKVIASETQKEFSSYASAGKIAQEVFNSIRTVISLNGAKFEQDRYERELGNSYWYTIRKSIIAGAFASWFYLLRSFVYFFGFILSLLIMNHQEPTQLNVGNIMIIVLVFAEIISWIATIIPFYQTCIESQTTAKAVFRMISETEGLHTIDTELCINDPLQITARDTDGNIHFENINFYYPARSDVLVLKNLNLTVVYGKTTAIIGSSGSGKSTCVSLLLRYYEPSSGQIKINNSPIDEYNLQRLRNYIGVVSQEPFIFSTTIYENIRYGKENATQEEIKRAAMQANAHNFIMQLPDKYETRVGEHGVQISGGQKQLIALARALVKNPKLLILDEATSALDNMSEKLVQEALDHACQGRTTIIIAHRLSTIRNADYIYVLDNGSVIEHGTHKTLLEAKGKYCSLHEAQKLIELETPKVSKTNSSHVESILERPDENAHNLCIGKTASAENEHAKLSNELYALGRLLRMNSPEWLYLLLGCLACMVIGSSQSLHAFLFNKIIQGFNTCTKKERHHEVILYSSLILLLGLVTILIRCLQFGAFAMSGAKLTKRIRSKMFACLLRQEIAYFDRPENSCGSICVRLSSDALVLQQLTGTRLGSIIEILVMFTFAGVLGLWFSFQLTLVVSSFIFIIFFITVTAAAFESKLKRVNDPRLERASSIVIEVIHNMRTVKQLTIEKAMLQQYTQIIYDIYRNHRNYLAVSSLALGVTWSIPIYLVAAVFRLSLHLIEHNQLEQNNVTIVVAFVIFASQSINILLATYKEIGASFSAARKIFDLFDRTPTIDNGSTEGKQLTNFQGNIQFRQVTFSYPSRPTSIILNDFQLSVKSGQRVALVGAFGCGKSTVIHLIQRFYDVSRGDILLDGLDIRDLNIKSVRSCFGLVSQEPILFNMTIGENISYGLENIPLEEIINAATKANVHRFIEQLPEAYNTQVGQKGNHLSGGEKQRISIARAILRRPKVLLLDEATSALDSQNEHIVQETLENIQNDGSCRTSLIIAHRLSTIRTCDLICVVREGRITESGTYAQLMEQHGTFYQMVMQNSL